MFSFSSSMNWSRSPGLRITLKWIFFCGSTRGQRKGTKDGDSEKAQRMGTVKRDKGWGQQRCRGADWPALATTPGDSPAAFEDGSSTCRDGDKVTEPETAPAMSPPHRWPRGCPRGHWGLTLVLSRWLVALPVTSLTRSQKAASLSGSSSSPGAAGRGRRGQGEEGTRAAVSPGG